jgi:hypothetical protein
LLGGGERSGQECKKSECEFAAHKDAPELAEKV